MSELPIRTFIAIELPEALRDYLSAVGLELGRQLPNKSVRWVKPAQMHLTLRFLGDTLASQMEPLVNTLRDSLTAQTAFTLKLGQLGAFPSRKRPRVIWVGVRGDLSRLRQVHQGVETAVSSLGFAPNRRSFNPHLTLGRVKQFEKIKNRRWGGRIEPLPFGVTAIHLIQSELTPHGPRYTTLRAFELKVEPGLEDEARG